VQELYTKIRTELQPPRDARPTGCRWRRNLARVGEMMRIAA
jgi:hypothetical protein